MLAIRMLCVLRVVLLLLWSFVDIISVYNNTSRSWKLLQFPGLYPTISGVVVEEDILSGGTPM